eukprot:8328482-Pyramimonas_sp.AAC.1
MCIAAAGDGFAVPVEEVVLRHALGRPVLVKVVCGFAAWAKAIFLEAFKLFAILFPGGAARSNYVAPRNCG